jgi:hypothetical protein
MAGHDVSLPGTRDAYHRLLMTARRATWQAAPTISPGLCSAPPCQRPGSLVPATQGDAGRVSTTQQGMTGNEPQNRDTNSSTASVQVTVPERACRTRSAPVGVLSRSANQDR